MYSCSSRMYSQKGNWQEPFTSLKAIYFLFMFLFQQQFCQSEKVRKNILPTLSNPLPLISLHSLRPHF